MIDPFSIGVGVVIGGLVALLMAATKWARGRDGTTDIGETVGVWVGAVGPMVGALAALAAWALT